MDLKMPIMNGIHATHAIKEQYPDVAVLVLTTYDDDGWVLDAIRAGATGYLLKEASREALVAAIEGTVAGRTPVDPAVANTLFSYVRQSQSPATNTTLAARFSEREREVLRLLANGLPNAAIGEHLSLAEGTVRNHVTNILAKLDVTDRAQATALAWRYGLVTRE
jgi:DNA-binding NarL/FixJ family response regulator